MGPQRLTPSPVEVTTASNCARALWLLFADSDPSNRAGQVAATLATAGEGRLSLQGLIEARRAGRLVGAAWGQIMPGRTAVLWPAQLVHDEPEATALRLHEALEKEFREHDVVMAQASLSTAPTPTEARLRASGFRHAADVCYLASALTRLEDADAGKEELDRDKTGGDDENTSPTEADLEFETYRETSYARLGAIVEQTYEGTLDCPALDGVRSIDDVLEGHRRTGAFDPRRWMIVRHGDRDVGCLLLADHPEQNQWELVYMGLLPEARGRQWGLAVTRHAQRLAAAAGRERLVLAVDANNEPALATYRAAGMAAWERRRVFLKVLRRAPRD